jgi:hypothetical protein
MSKNDVYNDEEKEILLDPEDESNVQHRQRSSPHHRIVWILTILTVLSWCASLYLWFSRTTCPEYLSTDFQPMRPAIEYEERTFNGGLSYDTKTKKVIWDMDSSKPQYVGLPSDTIDEAWENLMRGKNAKKI